MELKLGVGDGHTRFESIFWKRPDQMSKVIQRSNCFRNALWASNLVGRTPDQRVMHCWGQRSCRGQPGIKLLRNALWLTNLAGRSPDRSVVHWWGRRSFRGQSGVKLLRNSLCLPNMVGRTPDPPKYLAGVKCHEGVSLGSFGSQIDWKCPIDIPLIWLKPL